MEFTSEFVDHWIETKPPISIPRTIGLLGTLLASKNFEDSIRRAVRMHESVGGNTFDALVSGVLVGFYLREAFQVEIDAERMLDKQVAGNDEPVYRDIEKPMTKDIYF
jgi:hypothetical protein